MKIGVITFWWSEDNYGQILQAYALQQVLVNMGHDAFLIKYDRRKDIPKTTLVRIRIGIDALIEGKLFKIIKDKIRCKGIIPPENGRNFNLFIEHKIKMTSLYNSYFELCDNPPDADVYITGSDQVWYFPRKYLYRLQNWVNAYFLNFGNNSIKRISYAASFSTASFSPSFYRQIGNLLNKFSLITVREKSGMEICHKCGVKAKLVLDPTLLLNKDDWQIISNKDVADMDLLLYFLGSNCSIPFEDIYEFAKEKSWTVKYIASQGREDNYEKITPPIEEFIGLIAKSKYLITNSFHGTVFAIIFNLPFIVIPLDKQFASMNERVYTLLDILDLNDRLANSSANIIEQLQCPINWCNVNKLLYDYRVESCDMLNHAIEE